MFDDLIIVLSCPAVLGFNMCYVVAAVVIDNDKVLMIQEAKPSCRGQWYLPAGRVEKKETLIVSDYQSGCTLISLSFGCLVCVLLPTIVHRMQ